MVNEILLGDIREIAPTLATSSINCIVTSPPYWGLRDYGVSGQIGLEPTPEEYVTGLVGIFRELRRVLADDGVMFLNLGDSYSTGNNNRNGEGEERNLKTEKFHGGKAHLSQRRTTISSNIANCLERIIKDGIMFIGCRCSLTISSKSNNILKSNNVSPDSELSCFFGVKRIIFKQRDNDFGQVVNLFDPKSCIRISHSVPFAVVNDTDIEIVVDKFNRIGVIVSDYDLNGQSSLEIPITALPAKNSDMPLTIKEPTKPISETITNSKSISNTITLNPFRESILNINAINKPIPFTDTSVPGTNGLRNFSITKASQEHIAFLLMNGVIELTIFCVSHLFFSNQFGSIIRYNEVYDKAYRKSNSQRAKQELGIPEMVKRGLMEDGWICRSTIIWSKPNPMPESVTDRPTKAHEYIFLLAKSERYYYDAEVIKEPQSPDSLPRLMRGVSGNHKNVNGAPGQPPHSMNQPRKNIRGARPFGGAGNGKQNTDRRDYLYAGDNGYRNKRSVWEVTLHPYSEAHFATFPPELIRPCILAGCPAGGVVLDPFFGSGTTGQVCIETGRNWLGVELNPKYIKLAKKRIDGAQPPLIVPGVRVPANNGLRQTDNKGEQTNIVLN